MPDVCSILFTGPFELACTCWPQAVEEGLATWQSCNQLVTAAWCKGPAGGAALPASCKHTCCTAALLVGAWAAEAAGATARPELQARLLAMLQASLSSLVVEQAGLMHEPLSYSPPTWPQPAWQVGGGGDTGQASALPLPRTCLHGPQWCAELAAGMDQEQELGPAPSKAAASGGARADGQLPEQAARAPASKAVVLEVLWTNWVSLIAVAPSSGLHLTSTWLQGIQQLVQAASTGARHANPRLHGLGMQTLLLRGLARSLGLSLGPKAGAQRQVRTSAVRAVDGHSAQQQALLSPPGSGPTPGYRTPSKPSAQARSGSLTPVEHHCTPGPHGSSPDTLDASTAQASGAAAAAYLRTWLSVAECATAPAAGSAFGELVRQKQRQVYDMGAAELLEVLVCCLPKIALAWQADGQGPGAEQVQHGCSMPLPNGVSPVGPGISGQHQQQGFQVSSMGPELQQAGALWAKLQLQHTQLMAR